VKSLEEKTNSARRRNQAEREEKRTYELRRGAIAKGVRHRRDSIDR